MPTLRMNKSGPFLWIVLFTVLACLCLAQQRSRRLILTDGSHQPAVKWEIKADRVRYLSAERNEWEELPSSMIDWPATNKYNQELESGTLQRNAQLSAQDQAEQKADEARSPTIAPGLRLPDSGGVYLLDLFNNKPALIEMVQSGGEINKNLGRNILRAAINPLATSKESIEIKGIRARVQAHQDSPALYVDVIERDDNSPSGETPAPSAYKEEKKDPAAPLAQRFRIVRADRKKDVRVVGNLKIAFYGKVSQQGNWIPTRIEPVSSEWVKVTPEKPLLPGEYALVEMLGGKQMNLYVWDFGVDPAAPANTATWTPVQPKSSPMGTNETPVLESRPK